MDPVFERRELQRTVHLPADKLQRNIEVPIMAQLRATYEGVCIPEGYVQNRSITVLKHSLGRVNLIRGGLDFSVKFQACICLPHPGQVFRAPVVLRSKIGLHAELSPMKILLPRDLHLNEGGFKDIQDKQEIEFEVKGSRFQQGDDSIVVLGQLRSVIATQAPEPERATVEEPMIAAASGPAAEQVEKRVTVPTEQLQSKDQPRKRRVITARAPKTNESVTEGAPPGPA